MYTYCDNQNAIYLSKDTIFHERTKYINVRFHFIRDMMAQVMVKVAKISTEENPSDILIKIQNLIASLTIVWTCLRSPILEAIKWFEPKCKFHY